jgi:DNA-directed RNA polymerase subunit RPC12/RpoP
MSSHSFWRKGEVKKFEFFRGGGDKTEYLFAAALALIVIGALVLTVKTVIMPPKQSYGMKWAQCEKCKAEFQVDADKHPEIINAETPAGKKQDCPKCGAKRSAWIMNACPKCGKNFVRPSVLQRGAKDECPYCHADYLKALTEKIRSETGNK